jgi:hypothetical protein
MDDVYCYAFVEDIPSASVARKLVQTRNAQSEKRLVIQNGYPNVMGGYSAIRKRCNAFLNMAKSGIHTFVITDLDKAECASALIRNWFAISKDDQLELPSQCVFRIAVRELESWILADPEALAKHLGIKAANFPNDPDDLDDPKQHLLDVIRRKGRRRIIRDMIPQGIAHIGPRYNEVLCDFVERSWDPERAAKNSPSLGRALDALMKI